MTVLKPYKDNYYLWKYLPSQAASIVSAAAFLTITTLISWRMYKLRSWFCLWFVIGGLSEVIGYAAREFAYYYSGNIGVYIIQATFLVLAPAFFAASIYMTLSRIIRCVKGEHLSIVRLNWLTKSFVIGDVMSLSVQGSSSGLTSHPNTAKLGEYIVVAGLFIQLVLLGVFFVTAIIFQRRLVKQPTRESYTTNAPWRKTLYMIYIVSALIFFRSIFRVVEFIQGVGGYSMEHEWTLYAFDGLPMFIVTVIFFFWFPGYIQPAVDEAETDLVENVELESKRHKGRWTRV